RIYLTDMNNTAVINIKTNPKIKKQAQAVASDLGLSLSAVINAYLRQLVRDRKVEYEMESYPSPDLVKSIKEARLEYERGELQSFTKIDDMIKFLEN
ncbi:MAG: type II toxin-antitoxin system RelB/DinJ family antitoxin, partial [Candidatus Vogelbacteria bacterium]|nr:type II toxin-antitoxin system RelB/DinJ family antitoxin [Candidatus Vogelbacteria bacterium]